MAGGAYTPSAEETLAGGAGELLEMLVQKHFAPPAQLEKAYVRSLEGRSAVVGEEA